MFAAVAAVSLVAILGSGLLESQVWGWLAGATMVFLLGAVDDCRALPAKWKLVGQMVAALGPVACGVRVFYLTNPVGPGMLFLNSWGMPVTVLWIVGLTNAFNLIDGLDGLAAGVCAIAGIAMTGMAMAGGLLEVGILSAVLAGASLGFLYFNFNPARVFMGDGGAYLLGYSLACLSVMGAMKTPVAITVVVPLLLFAVPILDTIFAVARRMVRLQPVMSRPDRGHLHHRLLRLGMTQRQAVAAIYAVSGVLCLTAFLLYRH
jgi:UDP-GlcNAc:undecaprenyl-phosphate GlcNAc-1-phosphate transferase